MTSSASTLYLGRQFHDEGTRSAWRKAVAAGRSAAQAAAASMHGEFACAIRDERLDRVFMAVDRFASHSICFRQVGSELRFSARADELVDSGADLDPQAIYDYLYFHCIPSPRTIYRDVYRLAPGHFAWFENGQLSIGRYWAPNFQAHASVIDFDDAKQRFLTIVENAVRSELDDGTPACFLSGGTDSSTVAGMIGRVSDRKAHTYSIGFDATGYDEMAYARLAAKHFGTEHHEYYVTPDDLVRGMPLVAASYDQPFGNSSVLPAYYCAKRAQEDGVRHLIAGDGGDELFGGNTRYAKQRVFGWYDDIPAPLRTNLLEPLLLRSPVGALPGLKKGRSYVQQAKVPMPDRLHTYNLLLRLGRNEVLTPEFLATVRADSPEIQQREVWAESAQGTSMIDRMLAYDWRFTLAESDLPKVRGSTALAGVSVGFPFLDTALLEFSIGLPPAYKLRGLKLRWFFKEALRGFLPDEILTKKKHGFGLPFGVWASEHDGLKALARDSFSSLAERGIVRPDFMRALLEHKLAEHAGYYGEMVWILIMLEQWLRARAPGYRLTG